MDKIKVALIYGGYSGEAEISQGSYQCVLESIDRQQFDVYPVEITRRGWFHHDGGQPRAVDKNDFGIESAGGRVVPDVAYIMIHGDPGENGALQGYLDMLGVPYTTCGACCSALTFNKAACKHYLEHHGIPTAKSRLLREGQGCGIDAEGLARELGLPLFVKPNNGGSSLGTTKVRAAGEIPAALRQAWAVDPEALAETFVAGTELSCGILKASGREWRLPATEIVPKRDQGSDFFDFKAKYQGLSDEITPARIPAELMARVQERTSLIYDLLGCSGVVRVDYLLDDGEPFFMEVNTVPGMSRQSIVPSQARAVGMSMTELSTLLIRDALERAGRARG